MNAFGQNDGVEIQQALLCKALEDKSTEKQYHENCFSVVVHALQSFKEHSSDDRQNSDAERVQLFSRFRSINTPNWHFKEKLEELSAIMDEDDGMDVDEGDPQGKYSRHDGLVKNIGNVVRDLRSIGFTSNAR